MAIKLTIVKKTSSFQLINENFPVNFRQLEFACLKYLPGRTSMQ